MNDPLTMPPLTPAADPPAGLDWDATPPVTALPGLTQAAELPPEPEPELAGGSPGARLRRAREARRMEPGRVANELRLKPAVIHALEHDDYASLPGPLFAGGYLRSYARLLGLDPEPLLEEFRRLNPTAEAPPPRVTPGEEVEPGGGLLVPLFSAIVVVALLVGVYLWWEHKELAPASVATPADLPRTRVPVTAQRPPPPATAPVPEAPAPAPVVTPTPPATVVVADAPPPDSAPATTAPALPIAAPPPPVPEPIAAAPLDPPPAAVPASPPPVGDAAPAPATPAGDSGVVLTFSGPSWVDVRDASGSFRLFGEMASGDRRALGGEPPYSFILGNASAVTVTVGDAPFDINTVARGNVARFRLDPATMSASPISTRPKPGGN